MRRDAHTPALPTPTQCRPYPPTAVAHGAPDRPRTTRAAGKQGPTVPERAAVLATPGRPRPPNHPPTLPARTGGGGTKQPLHDSASRDRGRVETHIRAPKRHPPATASAPNSPVETPGGSRWARQTAKKHPHAAAERRPPAQNSDRRWCEPPPCIIHGGSAEKARPSRAAPSGLKRRAAPFQRYRLGVWRRSGAQRTGGGGGGAPPSARGRIV